jgi:hypothetical protein
MTNLLYRERQCSCVIVQGLHYLFECASEQSSFVYELTVQHSTIGICNIGVEAIDIDMTSDVNIGNELEER